MENQTKNFTEQIVKQVINAWVAQNKAVTNFYNKYDDNVYLKEVAPRRNRAIYLLGHLIAINDGMLPMFELGEKLFPQLEAIFITAPDRTVAELPPLQELKQDWEKLNASLLNHFTNMNVTDWLSKHHSVSNEDFALDPLRNKLNVLMGRTNHQSYHLGQLNLLSA